MEYKIENWNNRIVFAFNNCKLDFDEFSEIIDKVINPDFRCEIEITSWTQAFSFQKNKIEIYFEHFYNADEPYFSFELLPFENKNDNDLSILKSLVDNIIDFKNRE